MSNSTDHTLASHDDYMLMRAMVERKDAALKMLFDRHSGTVYALCLRMLKDPGDAEQLLTDVFFELWETPARYDEMRATPMTYILRVTRSRAIDRLRRHGPVGLSNGVSLDPASGIDVPIDDAPSLGAESDDRRRIIGSALKKLDAEQRRAIEFAYFDGLSHTEIAAKLNKPLGTIKSHLRFGMMRLRELLSPLGKETDQI